METPDETLKVRRTPAEMMALEVRIGELAKADARIDKQIVRNKLQAGYQR